MRLASDGGFQTQNCLLARATLAMKNEPPRRKKNKEGKKREVRDLFTPLSFY
jgi:hypothetical protein